MTMPDVVKPKHYQLQITPDLEQFRFNGQVSITLEARQAVGQVTLNLLELAVWQCRLKEGDRWTPCAFILDPAHEALTVILPEPIAGDLELAIDYDGRINDKMAGFYRSAYQKEGRTHYIAVTQFQESSARQAFPCMDHPRYKATFDLTLNVPAALQAIANTPPREEKMVAEGLRQIVFERTPSMSTYLLFFGVGEFETVRDTIDPRVCVVTLPGLQHTTGLGLAFGRTALKFCEQYYGIDYPLAKLDLIAVPDFAFGAMENWGAITFRENLLLHFAETTSAEGVERICEVIAHEIAHQWFGNLVTPSDWKYLWLNESFATYFGFGVVADAHPDWGTWDQFLHTQTASAMVRDGLKATFPIELPGGGQVIINASTAPIIYNKGASMLRMVEGHIGPERYQQGVRTYLQRHAYGCAESRDLWEAFESETGLPVTAMVQNWIGQPGYPLVTARRHEAVLRISQQRFTYLPHESGQSWQIPIKMVCWTRAGESREQALLLEETTGEVALPADLAAYKLNYGQTGFFRVAYDDQKNLAALGQMVRDGALPYPDRWGLQNDLFALVRSGRAAMADYLDFLRWYEEEDQYLPLASIGGHLDYACAVLQGAVREKAVLLGGQMGRKVLARIGMQPPAQEPHTWAALRNQMLWQAAGWDVAEAVAFGVDQFQALLAGRDLHPDIARSVMQVGAREKGAAALEWFKQRFKQSPSEHERMNILAAMTAFREWPLVEEALGFALEAVPPRNQFIPIAAAAGNPAAAVHMWSWYRQHLDRLETFHPLLYERVITGLVPLAGMGHEEEVKTFFQSYVEQQPHLKDAVALTLENLEINTRLRAANRSTAG
jgi:aminopeptidase N